MNIEEGTQAGENWVTSSYVSQKLDINLSIHFSDIHELLFEYLKNSNLDAYIEEWINPYNLRKYKSTNIKSIHLPSFYKWKATLNTYSDSKKLLLYSFSPVKLNKNLFADRSKVEALSNKDIPKMIERLGKSFVISYEGIDIEFKNIDENASEFIDIGDWPIETDENEQVKYSSIFTNRTGYLDEVLKHKLKFEIVNLLKSPKQTEIDSLVSHLNEHGTVESKFLDRSYARTIPQGLDRNSIYVILTENEQDYVDSKEWFLSQSIPFQHINQLYKYNNTPFVRTMAHLEMLKKMDIHTQYLRPDPDQEWPNIGFLYINDIYLRQMAETKRLLETSYVYADDRSYTSEKVFVYDQKEIEFYANRDYLNVRDPEAFASKVSTDESELIGNKLDILITKQMKDSNVEEIVNKLQDADIEVNRVYFVSNHKSRVADNFSYAELYPWIHPYYLLTKNTALIKIATKLLLFPQLFNTIIQLKYPLDAQINRSDVSKIIWLSKKRTYRFYNLPNITQLEPILVYGKNKNFLAGNKSYFFWLRHLI